MIAVGKLREDTFHLKLHASPNGRVVGYMNKGDEFVLANELALKNVGGKIEWQRGTVTSKGTTYSDVYVARERLDLVWQHLPPSQPTEPPWDDKFPPDVPRPDAHDSPLPAPERKAWWRFRLFRSWTEAPGLLICIIITLTLAWCSLAPAQTSWCGGGGCRYTPITDPAQLAEMQRNADRRDRYEKKWGKGPADGFSDKSLERIEKNPSDPDCWQYAPEHC